MAEEWWVLKGDQPTGPVTADLLLRGIAAGRVPSDTLVCEVGGAAWRAVKSVPEFARAVARVRLEGPTIVDPSLSEPGAEVAPLEEERTLSGAALSSFDDAPEHTVADASPLGSSPPPDDEDRITQSRELKPFEESSDTAIMQRPVLPSDPPR